VLSYELVQPLLRRCTCWVSHLLSNRFCDTLWCHTSQSRGDSHNARLQVSCQSWTSLAASEFSYLLDEKQYVTKVCLNSQYS